MPFAAAAQRVLDAHAADGVASDVTVFDLSTWAFGSVAGDMALARVPLPGRDVGEPLRLRELAFKQLCERIAVPAPYVRGLPAKLQVACVNWGLAQADQNALLRLAGGEVRAVVSDRYAALDDAVLLDVVGDVLKRAGYASAAMVRATAVGPHAVLRITLPNEGVAVRRGDVIEYGLDVGNSELGLRSVQVTPITYRLICTNGMRAWKSEAALRMRHVGDPDRLRAQLKDAIPVAFAEARGDIAKWKTAVEVLVDSALEEIEGLRGFGLSGSEVQAVGRQLVSDRGVRPPRTTGFDDLLRGPTTAFEVANAMTAAARNREATAARLSLEEVAHRYLSRRAA
jgi:hypothetical protein